MRFSVKQIGSANERIGILSGFQSTSHSINTPTTGILTQGGSVVHLTGDVVSKVFSEPQLLWVPLSNSIHLEIGLRAQGEGVAKFSGLPGHMTCAALHNLNDVTPSGHFENDNVPLWTRSGKKMISAKRYMDLMEVFKPDVIVVLADGHLTLKESHKRILKSVRRTCNLFDMCVQNYKASRQLQKSSLIGVISGTGEKERCDECIKHILQHKDVITGIALAGITDGTDKSLNVPIDKLEDVFQRISANVPKDLVKIVEGPWNPCVILTAIQYGWDVFDGSYPAKLTSDGQALVLNLDMDSKSDELCILDLKHVRYKEEFKPVLDGCECLTCKKHTRAYIQHLLNTKEMLAMVLLNIHNLHHFNEFFQRARDHIASNTYQMYKDHITEQYNLYIAQSEVRNTFADSGIQMEDIPKDNSLDINEEKHCMHNGDCNKEGICNFI